MSDAVTRSACAKVILCGEHAVVYGRPAIALPLPRLRTHATVAPLPDDAAERPFRIIAPDIRAEYDIAHEPNRPLAVLSRLTFEALGRAPAAATLSIASDIPPATHLGSSASVAVASARAIAAFCGQELDPEVASRLAFEAEKIYHGSPSGIDNTVVAYEQPVWFVRGAGAAILTIARSPVLVIADTGITTPTRIPVGDVRAGWETNPARYERLFDQIAATVTSARTALLAGDWPSLGAQLDANHALLQQIGVSSPELDNLCNVARSSGALGAKLSGGGRGGNMIALAADEASAVQLRAVLRAAGATRVI
ncbi:MAG TPA: mevalonate kinase [Anaerolineae bacterium]|jgi:mevalonate kinase